MIDNHLKTPYAIDLNMSFQRNLGKGIVLDLGYVGTMGRSLLAKVDYAQYLNITDTQSKTTLFQAYSQIVNIAGQTPGLFNGAANVDPFNIAQLQTIKSIKFFDDMMPNMPAFTAGRYGNSAYASLTPTQAFYAYTIDSWTPSWSCALFALDTVNTPTSSGFGFPTPWNSKLDPNGSGFVLFTPQFSSLPGWSNFGNSNFNSLQVSVRKTSGPVVYGANYVYSKGIDNTSAAENQDNVPNSNLTAATLNGLIQNPFDLRANRAPSDYDLRHNFNGFWVADLPFGTGKRFANSAGRMLDAVIGGWQWTGTVRFHTGFPLSPTDGFNFPTNFFQNASGTLLQSVTTSLGRCRGSGDGSPGCFPNLFANPAAAVNLIAPTLPGGDGSRNRPVNSPDPGKTETLCSSTMNYFSHALRKISVIRRSAPITIAALCFLVIAPTRLQAQHDSHEAAIRVPEEILHRSLPLRQGIGKVHEAVATPSPEAQAYYDQGLAYLHSFVWIEAARSFYQVLRLDPSVGMAYLGLSDAYVGLQEFPEAVKAFEQAQSLAEKFGDRERARVVIRARQLEYLAESGNLQKYFAYRQAVADALAADPKDPWLWILRGFANEGSPLAHGQGGGIDTIAFYETALQFSADNFAAHHYIAHTLENHGPVKDALQETENYVRLAPAIPHAHHMVGHNLRRLGRTEEAIQEFLKAEELEDAYYQAEKIPAQFDWHHAHNLQLLGLSYQALGQLKAAEAKLHEAFLLPAFTDFAEFNRRGWPQFLLERDRPQEALDAAQEMIANSSYAMGRFAGQTLAGQAYLAMNRLQDATTSLVLAEREMEQLPAAITKSLPDAGLLNAEIMLYEKNWSKGNALIGKLEAEMVAVPGPDAWSESLFQLESIATVARRVGDWEVAESTAQMMIQHDPSYAGGYFASGAVAEHQGDATKARREFGEAEKRWSKADPQARPSQVHWKRDLGTRARLAS